MIREANKHRRDVSYSMGEFVGLKFRLYRHTILYWQGTRKMAPRYFGPFEVLARVGAMANRLQLLN